MRNLLAKLPRHAQPMVRRRTDVVGHLTATASGPTGMVAEVFSYAA
jgi:hypothetical protein